MKSSSGKQDPRQLAQRHAADQKMLDPMETEDYLKFLRDTQKL